MKTSPLFILAFDHRQSLQRILEEAGHPNAGIEVKRLVADGFARALASGADPDGTGILIDSEIGVEAAERARDQGWTFALALEKSGRRRLQVDRQSAVRSLDRYRPTFGKILIRHNPADPGTQRTEQLELVASVADICAERGVGFMLELLIPPLPQDLMLCGGSMARYDAEVRPRLTVEAVDEIRGREIEAHVWKIEGFTNRAHYEAVATAILDGAQRHPRILTLGRGADLATVRRWLQNSIGVPGYSGFAVGRTLWQKPVLDVLEGAVSKVEGAETIARSYLELISLFSNGS